MDYTQLNKPSLTLRIGIGKMVGLVIGLAGLVALPLFAPEASWMLRWGIVFWYTTLGAIIGVFGVFTEHPVLHIPFPWWVRAPFLGAWMNFVLTLFAYDQLQSIMISMFGTTDGVITSPFWFVLEGAIVGLIIGFAATRLGGEGSQTVHA